MKKRRVNWLSLIILMVAVDTIFLYGLPYLSGIIEINPTVQIILIIVIFIAVGFFPIFIDRIIGKGGVGVLVTNNIIIMIVAIIFFSLFGNEAKELNRQFKSIGGAYIIDAGTPIEIRELDNKPFVELKDAVFESTKPYIAMTHTSLAKDTSSGNHDKTVTHCLKLKSHKTIRLCVDCKESSPSSYIDAKICKKRLALLDSLKSAKKINGIVKGEIKSKYIKVKPILEDFNSYKKSKNSSFQTVTPWGYLVIPISFILVILFG